MRKLLLSLLMPLVAAVAWAKETKESELLDYSTSFHNGAWEYVASTGGNFYGKATSTGMTPDVVIEVVGGHNVMGYATREGAKRPWLQSGYKFTISLPNGYQITEYEINTRPTNNSNLGTFKYTTADGMATATQTADAAGVTTSVTGLTGMQSITIDMGDYTKSGTHGILIYGLKLKYRSEEIHCTYNYTYNGEVKGTEEVTCVVDYKFPTPQPMRDFLKVVVPTRAVTAEDDGETIEIPLENDFPFTVSTSYDDAKWYYMNIRSNNRKWLKHSDVVPYPTTTERTWESFGLWAFVGNPFDGIQVLNRVAGANCTLGYDDAANAAAVHMMEGTTTWAIAKAGNDGGFTLHIPGEEDKYINDFGSSALKIWASSLAKTDQGSIFHVQAESNVFFLRWGDYFPWVDEDVADIPSGVKYCEGYESGEDHTFRKAERQIKAVGGNITVTFTWKGGSHMLKIAGVDIVDADGNVVKSDYHEGRAGGNSNKNVYTLSEVPAGIYTMRYFVLHKPNDPSAHDLTMTNGEILVTGADLAEISKIVYRFILEGVERASEEHVEISVGEDYPEIDDKVFPYGIVAPKKPVGKITLDDVVNGVGVKIIELEENLPFTKSVDFASATWYYMNIRSDNKKWVAHSETLPYSNAFRRTADYNGQWAFMGNPYDGFLVLNRAVGDGYTLGCATGNDHDNVHMMQGTHLWTMEEGVGGFILHVPNSTSKYVHDYGSSLQIWNSSGAAGDAGSAFNVEAVDNHISYQTWGNHFPWTTDDVTDAPVGVCSHNKGGAEHHLRKAETRIKAAGGDITVTFTYKGGGSMLMIAGIDLVNTEGEVVKTCYQEGTAGNVHSGNTYTLSDVEAGEYTMRYFVCEKKTGTDSHDLTHTEGDIVINGADLLGVDVKYIFTLDDVERATETYSDVDPYALYPDITTTFPYGIVTPSKPAGAITTEIVNGTVTKTIELATDLPFVPAADNNSIEHWYYMQMHSNYPRYIQNMDTYMEWTDTSIDVEERDSYTWAFVGNPYDGFKLVNYAAGTDKAVNSPGSGNPAVGDYDTAVAWEYAGSQVSNTAEQTYFCLVHPDVPGHKYMNAQSGKVAFWNSNDPGSSIWLTERDLTKLQALIDQVKGTTYATGTTVGYYTEESVAAVNAAVEAAETVLPGVMTKDISDSHQNAINTAIANLSLILPEADKFYTIQNCMMGNKKYMGVGNDAGMVTSDDAGFGQVFRFVPDGNGAFYLCNVERGSYLSTANAHATGQSAAAATAENEAKPVAIAKLGQENEVSITPQGGAMLHHDTNYHKVVAWNYGDNNANEKLKCSWVIAEVSETDIPRRSETITNAGWATFVLGCNTAIPEGVKAYTVSSVDTDRAFLTEVTGTIPANVPVLLNATPGTYEFDLVSDAAPVENNMLEGTVFDTSVAKEAYVLSIKDGKVGLYKAAFNVSEGTTDGESEPTYVAFKNNAFKAYLPANGEATARFLVFDFGTETGVDGIDGTDVAADAEVYDLAGRRVMKTHNGLYIVNGKKVIK